MEVMTFVGRRFVNFTDDKGKQITGWSLFYTMPSDGVEGLMSGKMFISEDKVTQNNIQLPKPGEKCEVYYDRYGRPQSFNPIK